MRSAAASVITLLLAGCLGVPPPGIHFPTYGSMNALPVGVLEGTLVEEDGCLLVEAGGSRWLVLWPGSARAVEADAGLVVRDGTNEAVVGEPIRLGGGEYGMDNYDFVVDLIDEEVPPACRESEQFWLGYPSD